MAPGPDLAYRVRDAMPGYVRRRAMDRLEHRGVLSSGLRLAEGAIPMLPGEPPVPRSVRISPKRLRPPRHRTRLGGLARTGP